MYVGYQFANITNKLIVPAAEQRILGTNSETILTLEENRKCNCQGITIEEIDKIYDNIIFLHNHMCKSLPQYRKFLTKKDEYIEVKKE